MPTAYVHIRETPHYRKDAFTQGLTRLGFTVVASTPSTVLSPKDVLVCWNKTARSASSIALARKGGATVLIAENGYHGVDENGVQRYALALDGHNGSGRWYAPDASRLDQLNIDIKPWWFKGTGRILIAAQRGIGSPLMRSPHGFEGQVAARLHNQNYHPIVRQHPGIDTPPISLEDELENAEALVVWSSNCATKALIDGVPTFYAAPTIVSAGAALPLSQLFEGKIEPPSPAVCRDAFARMAWAQWTVRELTSGEPFRFLIDVNQGRLPSCLPGLDLV